MTDMRSVYAANLDALEALVTEFTAEQLAVTVPGTPQWSVKQVVAHLAGGASDYVNDRMDGAPSPEWTARHVAERDEAAAPDLVDELRRHQDAVAAGTVGNPRPAIAWDIGVHQADIREALDLGALPAELWQPVLEMVAPYKLSEATAVIRTENGQWGNGSEVAEVSSYELYRAIFSRRSRTQMQAWGTPVLTPEQLDAIPVFGPRDDDQPLPQNRDESQFDG